MSTTFTVNGHTYTWPDDFTGKTGYAYVQVFPAFLSDVLADLAAKVAAALGFANSAQASATDSQNWASLTGSLVDAADYSSKEWAVGGAATGGSAKLWATLTGAKIQALDYSAKEYAVGTFIPAGSSKAWATLTGASVDGTDYSAKEYASGTAVPTGSAKYWAEQSAAYGAALTGNYASALTIQTGALNITIQPNKQFQANEPIVIYADAATQMWGFVVSYNAGSGALSVNVTAIAGSGSHTNWTIMPAGAPGAAGVNPVGYLATVGGTANAITLTTAPAVTQYQAGLRISFIPPAPNTGPVTVDVSALGNVPLLTAAGLPLSGNELAAQMTEIILDAGGNFRLVNATGNDAAFTLAILAM